MPAAAAQDGNMDTEDDYATAESDDSEPEPTIDELNEQIRRLEELKQKRVNTMPQCQGLPSPNATYATVTAQGPVAQQQGPAHNADVKAYFSPSQTNAQQPEQQEPMQYDDLNAEIAASAHLIREIDAGLNNAVDFAQPGPSHQDHSYSDTMNMPIEGPEFHEVVNRAIRKHAGETKIRKGRKNK